jgi:hypothetical protein
MQGPMRSAACWQPGDFILKVGSKMDGAFLSLCVGSLAVVRVWCRLRWNAEEKVKSKK